MDKSAPEIPVAASYCDVFLQPEMLHLYRQMTALRRFRPIVLTRQRENEVAYPYPYVRRVARPLTLGWRRFWCRTLLGRPVTAPFWDTWRVIRAIRQMQASVLHIYFGQSGLYLLPLLRRRVFPTVVSFYGQDATLSVVKKSHRLHLQELFTRADLVIGGSEALVATLANLGCDPAKLRLHRTGVSLTSGAPIIRTPAVDGDFRFIQAGRLIEKHGLDTAIRAFALFAREYPLAEFFIVGEGPLKKRLQRLAVELGIKEQVHFPGFLPQKSLHELYERCHAFIQPSQTTILGGQEGIPNTLLEAMAAGMPVLGTRHGSLPEAVAEEENGLLVPEKDVAALGAAFLRLGRDGVLLQRLSVGAVERVRAHFDRQKQARLLEELYQETIARHAGDPS